MVPFHVFIDSSEFYSGDLMRDWYSKHVPIFMFATLTVTWFPLHIAFAGTEGHIRFTDNTDTCMHIH